MYNFIVVWIFSELRISISSVLIYHWIQSDIRVKSYCRLNLLRAFVFNFGRQDVLRDTLEHPSKRYCRLNLLRASVFKFERLDMLQHWIGHLSKKLLSLNFLRASVFNFERLDIVRDSIGHPRKKLLWFEFARSYNFQFGASRYITGLNRTSE